MFTPDFARIRLLWPTVVFCGRLDWNTSLTRSGAREWISQCRRDFDSSDWSVVDLQFVTDFQTKVIRTVETCIRSHLNALQSNPSEVLNVCGMSAELVREGYHCAVRYRPAKWTGLYFYDCVHTATSRRRCGKVLLHDPRSNCGMVFTPGLPFGRPIVIDPEPGLLVIFPSWVGYSTNPIGYRQWQIRVWFSLL